MSNSMRWQPSTREKTFLRFLTHLAEIMGIKRKEICRSMAWHFWSVKRWDALSSFKFLAQ